MRFRRLSVCDALATLLVALVLSSVPAMAQTAPTGGEKSAASTPLRVRVTISRLAGDKKIAVMPYSLVVNAGDRDNRVALRMGVALPVAGVGKDGAAVSMTEIGTNMDCTAAPAESGRFRIHLAVNHSSVYESDARQVQSASPRPGDNTQLVRSFTTSFSMLLGHGETGQSIAATDPVTGEVMTIDVALTVLK